MTTMANGSWRSPSFGLRQRKSGLEVAARTDGDVFDRVIAGQVNDLLAQKYRRNRGYHKHGSDRWLVCDAPVVKVLGSGDPDVRLTVSATSTSESDDDSYDVSASFRLRGKAGDPRLSFEPMK